MVWPIRSKSRSIISSMAALKTSIESTFTGFGRDRSAASSHSMKFGKIRDTRQGFASSLKRESFLKLETSSTAAALTDQRGEGYKVQDLAKTCGGFDFFEEMKQRFLSFKKHEYLKELEHFQSLAEAQTPKVIIISKQTPPSIASNSRVCPSNILGFQPGETFMIRNVANLVPPLENGPCETNAALQFAVTTLEVENILVIGHSDCGGIQALMRMQDNEDSRSLTENWVVNAKVAKFRTKAYAAHLSFDQQCRHCEKESINRSLINLLTYPWIEDRVRKGLLTIHGGHYDLMNCTFEKWTLDYKGSKVDYEEGGRHSIKDHSFWS